MPECPIARLSNWRFGSRRDETRRDDARHSATRGMSLAEEQNEVYDALIRELVRVPDDVRDAVASFLQDLRRDGVDWHWIGDGGEFRTVHAGACMRAARIMGSGCLKFAHEHVAPWDEWTCAFAAMNGNLECLKYAHEHGCPWNENTCIAAAKNGHLECLKYACAHGCPGSAPYVKALKEVVLPDADERFVVEVALVFHRSGEISMREFLPLWAEHRMFYRKAHYEAVRKFHASLRLNR